MTDRNKLKERARDELFSHINRCGVLEASDEQQREWMDDTLKFLEEHGCIREVPTRAKVGAGRPPSPVYIVNPCLLPPQDADPETGR